MKKIILGAAVAAVVSIALFLLYPAPIDPAFWSPPKPKEMTGPLSPNTLLRNAALLARGKVDGPEETAVDRLGRVYGGTQDGKIVRILTDGTVETFVETGGRPLGMRFDRHGSLIVCDAYKGLLSIDPKGAVRVLSTSAEGVPFLFTDALDIARDGTIYFTDASFKHNQSQYMLDLLEARPRGRFLAWDPASGQTRVLLRDLYFANGVALSPGEDFVLVNETYRYRIVRYWLKGPRAGKSDIFIDNLPGFPDNISAGETQAFWVAVFTVRNKLADRLHRFPFLKAQMSKLPRALWPRPEPYGLVLALDEKGNIVRSLHDPGGDRLKAITSAVEHNGFLYLGSLHNDRVGKYRLP
ncbi:conserved hypothetical protein [Candidatus Desulfarcum epimagneticum]|uniref:Strictosidine synthase conserved region domain-containing protein n=1 Tax=uncultured Desulfobacteraceae bacterium TaxID=218296 RepID=A0A484HBD3_9BACT|nr:conserved hypothetical protein [uncultured Desulfobacteraceae bacterium]